MKFILHEIKLWFKKEDSEPKSYFFLPDKINVITGGSTTGKTSFWGIIDYCLLSNKVKVANIINEKVLWFGIRFTINEKEISIVRKTPTLGAVSSEICFNYGAFPQKPISNKEIAEIKTLLDGEFGITDQLRFPFGKELGKTSFNLSYRYFLLFNALSENVIAVQETFFDTAFFGKQEYDNALSHIFNLVIGVNDMEKLKALERLREIDTAVKAIQNQEKKNQNNVKNFKKDVFNLIDKCKHNNLIEYANLIESVDEAITIIQNIVENKIKVVDNTKIFYEIDDLSQKRKLLQFQIDDINKYNKEYNLYKNSLNKTADSLKPIEFLHKKLSDQLVDSYETKMFIDSLESSLKEIKGAAFGSNQIQSVVIPNGVTSISNSVVGENSWGAFAGNPITTVVIPPSLARGGFYYSSMSFREHSPIFGRIQDNTITRIIIPAGMDERNLSYNFEEAFVNFWINQNRAGGTYFKRGPIWFKE